MPSRAEAMTLTDQTDFGTAYPADPICGMDYQGLSPTAAVVRNWHNEVHEGAFGVCSLQPCDAVRMVES